MDKIKVYQDVLNEGHYKLLSDNLETIKEDDLLSFEEGIPGFEDLSDFIIAPIKSYEPFMVLQSLQNPDIGMIILPVKNNHLNPAELSIDDLLNIYKNYISKEDTIYFICRFSNKQVTINTKAPLVVNHSSKIGYQPIIDHDNLKTNDDANLKNIEEEVAS
tara:strand:+ start:800 stop:1282 length:483 start_codon:yes stop_codon:yes gene_type:complete